MKRLWHKPQNLGVVLFVSSVVLSAAAIAAEDGVLLAKVDASGQQVCKIDYRNPADSTRTGVYTGQCEAGRPEGAGKVVYHNGDRFEGEFRDGLPHGKGSWFGAAGDSYRGEWVAGMRSGEGTYRWASGSEYSGHWHDDRRHGQGTF
ncbi:MAG: hypothetical protein RBS88_00840, partial [Spongiibacteraceae bacterium]|nr:hypothetical protein [Spongiibacteraceae bacterium]